MSLAFVSLFGDLCEPYVVDMEEGIVTIWCENMQTIETTLEDLEALVKELKEADNDA